MNVTQIVIKTIITTVDLLVAFIAISTSGVDFKTKKLITWFILVNLAGVWI
jgi:hypothetical protein